MYVTILRCCLYTWPVNRIKVIRHMLLRETRLSSNWRGMTLQFDLATLSTQRLSETSDATYETYVNSSSFEFAVAIKARLLLGSWWETIEASQPQVIKSVYVVHPPLRRSVTKPGPPVSPPGCTSTRLDNDMCRMELDVRDSEKSYR